MPEPDFATLFFAAHILMLALEIFPLARKYLTSIVSASWTFTNSSCRLHYRRNGASGTPSRWLVACAIAQRRL